MSLTILNELALSSIFSCPFNQTHLWQVFHLPKTLCQIELNTLIKNRKIIRKNDLLFLPNHTYAKNTNTNALRATKYLAQCDKLQTIFSKLPGLVLVGVSGSTAAGYAKPQADIDLFFLCHPQALWICRVLFLFFLYLGKYPVRRANKPYLPSAFCPNLFLPFNKSLPSVSQNQRVARDMCYAKIIYDPANLWPSFVTRNTWLQRYYPEFYTHHQKACPKIRHLPPNPLLFLVNICMFIPQYLYLYSKKRKGELVSLTSANFNLPINSP